MTMAAVILLTVYFEVAVRVQLTEVIRTRMRTVAHTAVAEAVSDFLIEHPDAGDRLAQLQFSDSGTVAALTTDAAYIDCVKTEINRRAQEYIDTAARVEGIDIPMGSFTGLMLLGDFGPDIRLSVGSESTVSCTFQSSFESAGVNQAVHHIALIVRVDIAVYHPFRIRKTFGITSDFEIAQTVIVGAVPTYGGIVTY